MEAVRHYSAHSTQSLAGLLNPLALARGLWAQRGLIRQLAAREVAARYRGSALGMLWSLLLPLAMLAVYTFVFSVVFNARFDVQVSDSRVEFALTLFCGLLLFTVFAECTTQAPSLIVSNPSYVKKVVFPLEVLVPVKLAAALLHGLISLGVLLAGTLIFMRTLSPTLALLPLVLVPLVMLALGVGWFLASLGVYVRDAAQAVGVVVNVLFFLTPVFYPVSAVPEGLRWVMWLNPMTAVVESARMTVLRGQWPAWEALGLVTLASAVVMQLGYAWFMKTRRGFADVL